MSTDKTLYMVGTPIGNLEDFSPRALRVLRHVKTVFSEDTRVTAKLLASFDIQVTCKSINEHTSPPAIRKMLDGAEGDIAFVTDAGMPGISDPGGKVVEIARELKLNIVSIPGPSAVTAALSVSGFPTQQFTMMGFPPHKKGRKTFFEAVAKIDNTVVLFESKHRFLKTLAELPQNRLMTVGRELTKMHEEVATGLAGEIADKLTSAKGEFTIVLAPTWYK